MNLRKLSDFLCIKFILLRSLIKGSKAEEKGCKVYFDPTTGLNENEWFLMFNLNINIRGSLSPPLSALFPGRSFCDVLVCYKNADTPVKICLIELKSRTDMKKITKQLEQTYRFLKEKKLFQTKCKCMYHFLYVSRVASPKSKSKNYLEIEGERYTVKSITHGDLRTFLR